MGRKVQPRASYLAEAGYLIRLAQAVELDERHDAEWRRQVTGHITSLVSIFNASTAASVMHEAQVKKARKA